MEKVKYVLVLIFGWLFINLTYAQCIPGDETSCPDPENNGEVCPDSLPNANVNQYYEQVFTILAPPQYTDSVLGVTVDLHHLKLLNVGNLPPGIGWVSNTQDSVFMVGTYYCVLLDGTPTEKGEFPLEIEVEVYISFLGNPILADTIIDSTSLTINVTDPSSIHEFESSTFSVTGASPNPFQDFLNIGFTILSPGEIKFELFDVMGNKIDDHRQFYQPGENNYCLKNKNLKPGLYVYSISDNTNRYTARVISIE
nr:T9SS type A sorting domain-containing protein [Bacteroidota bacterium]